MPGHRIYLTMFCWCVTCHVAFRVQTYQVYVVAFTNCLIPSPGNLVTIDVNGTEVGDE